VGAAYDPGGTSATPPQPPTQITARTARTGVKLLIAESFVWQLPRANGQLDNLDIGVEKTTKYAKHTKGN
jgi:hypothetical protein